MADEDEEVEQKLADTVRAVRLTLERIDEDAANDPSKIKEYIEDETNHVALRGEEVDEEKLEKVLEAVKAEEVPMFEPPEGVYPLEHMLSGSSVTNLEQYHRYLPVGVHHAQGGLGSKGSYIIACKLDSQPSLPSLMVLKQSTVSAPIEVFASMVMRKLGLKAPRFKVLSPDEFRDLATRLRSAQVTVAGSCATLHEPSVHELGALLMEYLPGKTLTELDDPSVFNYTMVLRDIGRCMAADMALNCLDRIPVVWNNDGNPTNLLIATDTHAVHVIDSAYNRVLHEESFKERMERIKAAVKEARSVKLGEHALKVRDFFSKATNGKVKLTDGQLTKMFFALAEACDELARNHKQLFETAARETRELFERAGCADKFDMDQCLDLDFCTEAARVMLNATSSDDKPQ